MRYFFILNPDGSVYAAADEDALGRVLADALRQYIIGKGEFRVRQCLKEEFEAYVHKVGSYRIMNDILVIWIASYRTFDGQHTTITAYTDVEFAKQACIEAAGEFGLGLFQDQWTFNHKTRQLVAAFKHVAFIIEQRFLNGVSK